jgi:uncharacterized protein (TIGR02118 family)
LDYHLASSKQETLMVKLIALLKRKPSISPEAFASRWLNEHVKLSAKMPGLREYRINLATPRQPDGTADEPIYDGTAELWWDSIDDMERAFDSEIGKAAGLDADQFADVRIHIYTEEHFIVPAARTRSAVGHPAAKRAKPAAKKKRSR